MCRASARAGPWLLAGFVAASALRDVFLAAELQRHDVFEVAVIVFAATSLLFAGASVLDGEPWRPLLARWRTIAAVNALTAVAWLSYLRAVALLEPAIASTIWAGTGPLLVAWQAARGHPLAGRGMDRAAYDAHEAVSERPRRARRPGARRGLQLLAASLVYLALVATTRRSGLPTASPWSAALLGTGLAAMSGAAIAWAIVLTKGLHEHSVSARQVVAIRFVALVVVAGALTAPRAGSLLASMPGSIGDIGALAILGLLTIALPIYAVQMAVVALPPLTVELVVAMAPVATFALQLLDGRLRFSGATLLGLIVYVVALTWVLASMATTRARRTGSARHAT